GDVLRDCARGAVGSRNAVNQYRRRSSPTVEHRDCGKGITARVHAARLDRYIAGRADSRFEFRELQEIKVTEWQQPEGGEGHYSRHRLRSKRDIGGSRLVGFDADNDGH